MMSTRSSWGFSKRRRRKVDRSRPCPRELPAQVGNGVSAHSRAVGLHPAVTWVTDSIPLLHWDILKNVAHTNFAQRIFGTGTSCLRPPLLTGLLQDSPHSGFICCKVLSCGVQAPPLLPPGLCGAQPGWGAAGQGHWKPASEAVHRATPSLWLPVGLILASRPATEGVQLCLTCK